MKIVAAPAKDSSGWYRMRQPIETLRSRGCHLDLQIVEYLRIETTPEGRFANVELAGAPPDVLVLQRPMWHGMPDLISAVQARGVKVVIDLDDDFHTADSRNRAFVLNHPKASPGSNWLHLTECIKRADLITVSTDQLARRYGSHGRVAVLRNSVDDHWLTIPRMSNGATLGWPGTITNHPNDLPATRGGVAEALRAHPGWRFLCVGGAKHQAEIARQLGLPAVEATPHKPLELHPYVVASLDVGIVPLADTAFNAAKSWLKGLEMAALGIPFVASDSPEYELLASYHGIGILCPPKARVWRRELSRLMDNADRAEIGANWRQRVARKLTISKNAWRFAEAWEGVAYERRQNARGVDRGTRDRGLAGVPR